MKKFISYIFLGCIPALLTGQFTPPTSNSAVMVNESTKLVNPTASELLDANPEFEQLIYDTAFVVDGWQIIVDTTPSINPNDYITETSKNITIQTPYYDISELKMDKANVGEHLFNSGKIVGDISFPNFPFSICITYELDNFSTSASQVLFQAVAANGQRIVLFTSTTNKLILDISRSSATTRRYITLSDSLLGKHNLIWVARSLTNASNPDWDLYLDGKEVETIVSNTNYTTSDVSGNRPYAVNTTADALVSSVASTNPISIYDLKLFNFDMSAEDAPYTVADYVEGKSAPLTLRNGGGEVLELADTRSAYQIKDLSGNGNHATIFGNVISRYNENPTAMQVAYSWGSGVSTGAYIMGDTVTLPARSEIEIIGYSSASMTLNVGSSASASTSFASAAPIGTTPSSICTFYTGSSAQELYITPSVAGASINLTIKVTQIE